MLERTMNLQTAGVPPVLSGFVGSTCEYVRVRNNNWLGRLYGGNRPDRVADAAGAQ